MTTRPAPNSPEHRAACRRHAVKRAWQRFGLACAAPDIAAAEQRIWAGEAKWRADLPDLRSAWIVEIKGRRVLAIFDLHLDVIVTVLPRGMKLYGERKEMAA